MLPGDRLVDCTSKEGEELKEFVSASEIPVSLTRGALVLRKGISSLLKCFVTVEGDDCEGSRKRSFCVDDGVSWIGKSSDD